MRHGKAFNHLSRKRGHRKALLKNLAIALIQHKRINTTLAKAKALRVYIEPLLTKAKNNTTHARRTVFSYLQSKEAITELFGEVATKIADRPGGYTRVIRSGFRLGDGAEMAMIEMVDYNEVMVSASQAKDPGAARKKTRRSARRKKQDFGEPGSETATQTAEQE
ncbi:MAG: 50S ribosomal protein L17 [Saprospiraceae bacterium]|nr:50S ribosomal protein L17 [Saprospiraceae bacterium]